MKMDRRGNAYSIRRFPPTHYLQAYIPTGTPRVAAGIADPSYCSIPNSWFSLTWNGIEFAHSQMHAHGYSVLVTVSVGDETRS